MHIIAVRCLSTSIAFCSRAFLFFPSFTLSPSSLSSLFFSLLPFLFFLPFSPPSLLVRFPSSRPFFSNLPFRTPPFLLTSPFSPISSSLIIPLLSFQYFFSLPPLSRPTPLYLSYSSINSTVIYNST